MLGFSLNIWDCLALAAILLLALAFLVILIVVLGLPGKIAIARKHPEAEAVNLMGWVGFVAVVPWIQALIWAFKPTSVVDIRYFPEAEQREIAESLARLTGKKETKPDQESKPRE